MGREGLGVSYSLTAQNALCLKTKTAKIVCVFLYLIRKM